MELRDKRLACRATIRSRRPRQAGDWILGSRIRLAIRESIPVTVRRHSLSGGNGGALFCESSAREVHGCVFLAFFRIRAAAPRPTFTESRTGISGCPYERYRWHQRNVGYGFAFTPATRDATGHPREGGHAICPVIHPCQLAAEQSARAVRSENVYGESGSRQNPPALGMRPLQSLQSLA